MKTYPYKHLYMNVHCSIIHSNPKVETIKCPSTGEYINKMWSILPMEYYLALVLQRVTKY